MPQGVVPPAQLAKVPRTFLPDGSALVRSRSVPAAGPSTRNGVLAVIRRLSRAPRWFDRFQEPGFRPRSICTTDMPCEAIAIFLTVASS